VKHNDQRIGELRPIVVWLKRYVVERFSAVLRGFHDDKGLRGYWAINRAVGRTGIDSR